MAVRMTVTGCCKIPTD